MYCAILCPYGKKLQICQQLMAWLLKSWYILIRNNIKFAFAFATFVLNANNIIYINLL